MTLHLREESPHRKKFLFRVAGPLDLSGDDASSYRGRDRSEVALCEVVVVAISNRAMLGRDDELAAVEELLRDAIAGSASVVFLRGEAGIGKSTLAAAVVDRARDLGCRVGTGLCLDVRSQAPFGPILEALHRLGATQPTPQLESVVRCVSEAVEAGPAVLLL